MSELRLAYIREGASGSNEPKTTSTAGRKVEEASDVRFTALKGKRTQKVPGSKLLRSWDQRESKSKERRFRQVQPYFTENLTVSMTNKAL